MTGRIILIGMPASGKTTVGRAVAQALSLPFHDCDREVERLTGRTIPEIFAAEGEEAFRAVESRALAALCTAEAPCVIATRRWRRRRRRYRSDRPPPAAAQRNGVLAGQRSRKHYVN